MYMIVTDLNQDESLKYCTRALRDTLLNEAELTIKACAVAVVGKGAPFTKLDGEGVGTAIEGDERGPQAQDDTLSRQLKYFKIF